MAFEHDLGLGRHLERHGLAIDEVDPPAAQQTGELVLRQGVRHRRHRGDDRAGVGADHRGGGQRLALRLRPAPVMLRAAAMPEPAHQRRVAAGHLHAVDAEVERILPRRARPLGHDQRPGDQRRRLARPAGLDRQRREVDLAAAQHDLLARRRANRARPHRHHGLQQRQHVERLAPAAGRLRLFQKREGLADFAQLAGFAVHAPGDPLDRAEQIDQHRHAVFVAARSRRRSRTIPPARAPPAAASGSRSSRGRATPAPRPAPAARSLRAGR